MTHQQKPATPATRPGNGQSTAVTQERRGTGKPVQLPPQGDRRGAARNDIVETVTARNDFYKDGYRKMQTITLVAVCVAAFCVITSYLSWTNKPEPKYFPTGPGCRMIPMAPLSEPLIQDSDVVSFTADAMLHIYSYDFANWRSIWGDNKRLFTSTGWDSWLAEFERTGTLDAVRKNRLVVSSSQKAAGVIKSKGLVNGAYTWQVSIPLLITYRGASSRSFQTLAAEITLVRVKNTEVESGPPIRIQNIRAEAMAADAAQN